MLIFVMIHRIQDNYVINLESVIMTMRRWALTVLLGACAVVQASAQDLNKLLNRMPETTNTLTVIDIKGLMNTPKAAAEGWAQKRNMDYLSGRAPFPPGSNFCVVGSEFAHTEGRNNWQIALLEFPNDVYEDKLAKKEGSDVELIENQYVIPSRRNAYYVQFARDSYAVVTPANRQRVSRWISYAKTNKASKVNPYLVDAVQNGGAAGQINIAVDLSDTVNRVETLHRLQRSKMMTDANIDRQKWTEFLVGLRGVRLTVKVTDVFIAEVHLDFKEDVQPYAALLPGFLAETMESSGINFGDMSSMQATSRGKTLTLKGAVDGGDVRRVLSKVLPPMLSPEPESQLSGQALVATTSQQYFKAVDSLLKEMRQRSDRYDKGRNWTISAEWYEYTANKIDQLPIVNTDEQLVAYSAQIVDQLRLCGKSNRGVDIKRQVIDTYKRSSGEMGWGGFYGGAFYGYGGGQGTMVSNEQEITSAKAENAAKGANDRNAIWIQINEQTTAIRGALSKKYNIEF